MSMDFSAEQLAEIDRLRNGEGSAPFNYPARPYSGAYTYILHLISADSNPDNGPAAGVEAGVWNWFNGARFINRGEGVFSTFIREYTAEQNRIRTGQEVTLGKMNAASDKIGFYVIRDIIVKKGLIALEQIGVNDARGMTEELSEITIAGWSGNLLFPMLGEAQFFTRNITNTPADSYNFFALIRSANYALTQTLGNSWGDIFDGIDTIARLTFGDRSTLDVEQLLTVVTSAREFFSELYGESLATPLFTSGGLGNIGFTYANSFLFSNVVMGKSGQSRDVLSATAGDDLVHGGGGDDVIIASDASLAENLLFDSYLIDGGSGFDTLSYVNTGSIEFEFYKKQTLALFIAEAHKDWSIAFDSIYNVETIIGSSNSDSFSGTVNHLPVGYKLDGGAGNDSFDLKGGIGIITIGGLGRDWIFNTSNGGIIYGDLTENFDELGVPVVDGRENSDNIWFWPGVTVKGAGGFDQLKFFGFGLTGGGEGLPFILTGAAGMFGFGINELAAERARVTTVEHPLEGRLFTDNFMVNINYTFQMNQYGRLDMYVSNALTGLLDLLTSGDTAAAINGLKGHMKIENYTPAASAWGGSIKDQDGNEHLGLADLAAGTFGMKFQLANGYLGALAMLPPILGMSGAMLGTLHKVIALADAGAYLAKFALWAEEGDPLIIDLDGDGIETTQIGAGIRFDHDANLFAEETGWLSGDDGFLVLDANHNGKIDNGTEFFGGFGLTGTEELALHDSNNDGKISVADLIWNDLKIWRDADEDALTDAGELLTLDQAGITAFNLTTTDVNIRSITGNDILDKGHFTWASDDVSKKPTTLDFIAVNDNSVYEMDLNVTKRVCSYGW